MGPGCYTTSLGIRRTDEHNMDRDAMAKHIFVTGGVVSSLGKGLTCASIGMLLEQRGLRIRLQKFDPVHQRRPGNDEPAPAW